MTPTLLLLLTLLALSVGAAAWVLVAGAERRRLVARAGGVHAVDPQLLRDLRIGPGARLAAAIARRFGRHVKVSKEAASTLVHAGFDGPAAPAVYGTLRLAMGVGFPLLVWLTVPRGTGLSFFAIFALTLIIALMGPPAVINRIAGGRREKVRRAVPDALDLLVVCVEAGISLDAAVLRVAREMATLHPLLSDEFLIVNRRVNAGMPREEALHGLWIRTGVEELRGLAANMIQSEKWGTSIATVLRVYAETLRRKRRQTAEKKAAVAPLKMIFPLGLFIFPALFVVILGPAALNVAATLLPALGNK